MPGSADTEAVPYLENFMDISMNTSTSIAQTAGTDASMAVLKKSIDIQAQAAMALINAVPQPQPAINLPPNLGRNINTTA